jgi:WD40 repeat protein
MTGEKGSEENPFVNRRKKLVEDAQRISKKLEEEEAMELARAKAELERELIEAKKALINDIESRLAELPPLQLKTAGSTVVTSEAFAWFYDESEPLVVLDRPTLASGSQDNTIKLWNANTGKCLRTLKRHTKYVNSVAFSPDGRTLASGSNDNTIKLWNANTGKCLRTLQGHAEAIFSVAFSPDGTTLASGSQDNTIKLWNANTGKCLRTLKGHTNNVWSVAFSPDGKTLASGSYDNTIKLWNANTGKCLRTLERHVHIRPVAFSPDGTTLASGSGDRTIKLWNANTGKCLRTLEGHAAHVWSVAFSPDITFSRDDLNQIFNEVRAMLREADFGLSTKDGIDFTVSWKALE